MKKTYLLVLVSGLVALGVTVPVTSQSAEQKMRGEIHASLVDAEAKAARKSATVTVTVKGARMVDPASVKEQPRSGEAHLHYRVDGGPIIATTATKLSFHELSSGRHEISVQLAASDHSPIGSETKLDVTVP